MGEVYHARDSGLGREVAIKVLPDALAQDPDRLSRFEREARLLASVNYITNGTKASHQYLVANEVRFRRGQIWLNAEVVS